MTQEIQPDSLLVDRRTLALIERTLPEDLPFDDWCERGRILLHLERKVGWAIGDWWAFGERRYGMRVDMLRELGLESHVQTIKNAAVVCRAFPASYRQQYDVPFTHFAEVAALPRPTAETLLAKAAQERMTARELRLEVVSHRRGERYGELARASLPADDRVPVLYTDPPWTFHAWSPAGEGRVPANYYPVMSLEEICTLGISSCATSAAVLFMWTTAPHFVESLEVLKAWGFEYKTQMVWLKDRQALGYYVRNQHEPLIIATRGDFPVPDEQNRPRSYVESPRRGHSEKPHEFYRIINRMYPGLRKREFFGRSWCEGWERTWGNQAPDAPNIDPALIRDDGWVPLAASSDTEAQPALDEAQAAAPAPADDELPDLPECLRRA